MVKQVQWWNSYNGRFHPSLELCRFVAQISLSGTETPKFSHIRLRLNGRIFSSLVGVGEAGILEPDKTSVSLHSQESLFSILSFNLFDLSYAFFRRFVNTSIYSSLSVIALVNIVVILCSNPCKKLRQELCHLVWQWSVQKEFPTKAPCTKAPRT